MATTVTIAIATWNRAGLLEATLGGLARLRTPQGLTWEVMVCDNNSRDATRKVVEAAAAALEGVAPLRYQFQPTQGKSRALNLLLERTTSPWLLFLDDDVLVDEGLLASYAQGIREHPAACCFAGPIEPWPQRPVRGRRAFLLRHYGQVYGSLAVPADRPMAPPAGTGYGANLMLLRRAIPAAGFRVDRGMIGGTRVAGEDVAIQQDMLAAGCEGWLLAGARVRHVVPAHRMGVRHFCRWQMGIGRTWVLARGEPQPGRFGVPWWAWRHLLRRGGRAVLRWRPWPTRRFYDALGDCCQYYGYLRARR